MLHVGHRRALRTFTRTLLEARLNQHAQERRVQGGRVRWVYGRLLQHLDRVSDQNKNLVFVNIAGKCRLYQLEQKDTGVRHRNKRGIRRVPQYLSHAVHDGRDDFFCCVHATRKVLRLVCRRKVRGSLESILQAKGVQHQHGIIVA